MRSSPFLTPQVVARSIQALSPTIAFMLENAQLKRGTMHIVVVNPHLDRSGPRLDHAQTWINDGGILHEETLIVSPEKCDPTPYVTYAQLKAHLSWATGLPSGEISARLPHLLREDDTIYGGSATFCGLTCAVSGQPAIMDEGLAGMLLNLIVANCRMAASDKFSLWEDGIAKID